MTTSIHLFPSKVDKGRAIQSFGTRPLGGKSVMTQREELRSRVAWLTMLRRNRREMVYRDIGCNTATPVTSASSARCGLVPDENFADR
jgi:hypothetical protein